MTTLVPVGGRYSDDAQGRSELLYRAAQLIERRGYGLGESPRLSIHTAVAEAARVYSNPKTAVKDALFLINSRYLITHGVLSRELRPAWSTFAAQLDTATAVAFLRSTAELVMLTDGRDR